jgi:hypothetical protein
MVLNLKFISQWSLKKADAIRLAVYSDLRASVIIFTFMIFEMLFDDKDIWDVMIIIINILMSNLKLITKFTFWVQDCE